MKRTALILLALALPAAPSPATNAPAATPARADVDAAVLAKLDRIIVPEFEFKDADICDVVSRLGDCSREFDDETAASKRGVGFVLDLGGDASTLEEGDGLFAESPSSGVPPLTIKAKDWSLRALLDLVVEMADLKYRIEGGHVAIRRKDDMRGETFERWRFTILPGLDGRVDSTDTWKSFFGQFGVSWPRGSFVEPSGDDGLVVRNTRENLDTIRMIFGGLSVNVLQGEPVVLEDAPATNAPAATLARADDDGWPPLPTAVERLLEEFRTTGDCSSLDEAIWELKLAPVDSTAAALSNRIALIRRLVPFYDPDYDRRNPGPLYMHATPPKGYRTGTSPSAVSDPVERAAYEERIRVHAEEANARNIQHTLRGFFEDAAVFIEMIKPNDREELLRQLPEGFLPATRSPEAQGPHAENAEPQPHAKPAEIEPRAEAAEEKQ